MFPVRFVRNLAVPPNNTDNWQKIAFQPMLYTGLWIATILIMLRGDFTSVPPTLADATGHESLFWLWGGLGLLCPPLALVSVRLVTHPRGDIKYRGLWLRLAADIGQFTATLVYTMLRLDLGDYHVYGMGALLSCLLFIAHLLMRDVHRLYQVERLARQLHKDQRGDVF